MYEALGDEARQQQIRDDNPDAVHCLKLRTSAMACDGCKNNPYRKWKNLRREGVELDPDFIEEWQQATTHIFDIVDDLRMGVRYGPRDLYPEEAVLCRMGFEFKRALDAERDALILKHHLADLLAMIFGGGDKPPGD